LDAVFRQFSVAASTLKDYEAVRRNMLEFFGADRLISAITLTDCEDFRRWLRSQPGREPETKMAECTVSKRVQRARQFFNRAVKQRWLSENPFAEMRGWKLSNPERLHFVDRRTFAAVMDQCVDVEWRLILALCHFAGLRCPSEVMQLTWARVNWE
jgi:integrase